MAANTSINSDEIKPPRNVKKTATEIKRYLEARPNAAETVDGVAKWWLARQRYDDSRALVQAALEYLVAQGELKKRKSGGKEIYCRAARMR